MKNPFRRDSGESQNKQIELTTTMFLGLEGTNGYTTPSEFIAYGESLTSKEASNIHTMLDCMAKRMTIKGNPGTGLDSNGKPYTWHEFTRGMAKYDFKIVNGGGLPQLAQDYADLKVRVAFTLDDLIALARKS